MSRTSSEREYKDEQLLKELVARLQPVFTILSDAEADFVIANCNWYAEQKIKQMFDEENDRDEGLIRVRKENGILMLTPAEFEEYKKTLEGALLREVK